MQVNPLTPEEHQARIAARAAVPDTGKGKFRKGHTRPGPGNPHAKASNRFKAAIMGAVTEEDVQEVIRTLVREARAGNVQAARELLDRLIGKPETGTDLADKVEVLEAILTKVLAQRG
jgi:hypothetical protein